MFNIKTFIFNLLQENTYVVSDETKECVIIDCGAYYDEERAAIKQYIAEEGLKPVRLLCTHGHFDHNFGIDTIYEAYGLKPEIAEEDDFLISDLPDLQSLKYLSSIPYSQTQIFMIIGSGIDLFQPVSA